jgi:2-polyprenyl-3-methyl-5-hydroxy-6-metoxy-1,4-benzoquinol methylase
MLDEHYNDKQNKFYSKNYAKGSVASERLKKVISVLQTSHFKRLLDVGCGDGSVTSIFKEFSDEVYGIDVSQQAVGLAEKMGINAFKVNIDEENMPFGNEFFNAVFCGEIIEHLYDPDHLLSEVKRVLVTGGICIITTPNLASWLNRIVLMFGFQPYLTEVSLKHNVGKFRAPTADVSGHIRAFTYKSLKELLQIHGFTIEKTLGANVADNLPFLISPIEKILSKRASIASNLIFVAKKLPIGIDIK